MRRYKHDRPTIGVLAGWQVYTGVLDSFLGNVLHGIQTAASDMGCNLLLACGVASPERAISAAWPFAAPETDLVPVGPWNTDGLIALPPLVLPETARYCQDLVARGHPLVFAGAGEPGPAVMVDNEGGIHQALDHLAEHGHRHIALIAGDELPAEGDSARRLKAYRSGLQRLGLPFDPNLVAHGPHNVPGGRQTMARILSTGAPFTAVLATNDGTAEGALEALREAGRRVPEDVAVIGFDDRLEARTLTPPLTTVHHPMFEMGYQAVLLLLRYIDGDAMGNETVTIPTQLMIRESCGCSPGARFSRFHKGRLQPPIEAPLMASTGQGPGARLEAQLAEAMSAATSVEMRQLSQDEVAQLCRQLAAALCLSLEKADPAIFRPVLQQALQHMSARGDDLHAWQGAVSALRDALPVLLQSWPGPPPLEAAREMLDQARVAIDEIVRVQHARHLVHQAAVAEQVGQMTARFLAARDEAEVFHVLAESLPRVGVEHAAVIFYEAEGEDPAAWSVLQPVGQFGQARQRFPSREFPPSGLYPEGKPFSLALLPLPTQQGIPGFMAFDSGNLERCADIVRQFAAALRSVRLYREAVEGRQLAEEANRLKSRFLSVVSHELRTPLSLIASLSDMLLQESEQASTGVCQVDRQDIKRIYVGAQHLDSLIRDVLDLARSDVGQLRLLCEPLDLTEVLRDASLIGGQLARDKELAWRADIPENLLVWGDRTRLRQVTLNLINNAVKFTARGEVSLAAALEDGQVTVMVRDTGLGIPLEEQKVIFDEFRQSERTAVRGYGGLGLGLAICRRLVEMHGGEIGVHSSGEEGQGSTFYFRLPVIKRPESAASAPFTVAGVQRVALLVKDERRAEPLRLRLMQRGFAVQVRRVDETTDWLARLLAAPLDVVMLDLELAAERGWEVLKILKENPATRDMPVLFSELASEEDRGSLLEIDYLTKPVGTAQMAEALMYQGLLGGEEGRNAAKTILIVDDEPAILEMHSRIVEAQAPHYRVLKARDGREALTIIGQQRPDLVLLDLMMPELDGFGVLEAMQEDKAIRNIPVIVLTGQVLTEEHMARLNRGVAGVLQKGLFTVEETLEHVQTALLRRRRLGSDAQQVALRAMAYIHAHYTEPISRTELAAHVGLSERHLTRCFRQRVGVTPLTYLNRYRIKQARALLGLGGRSITQVAMEVGFSSSNYFSRVFRQEVGVSPHAYLRAQQERPDSH